MNYINAHATSTLVGDVAELKAVKKVFTDTSSLKMNATKSMIGHCLGAAGGMEAVATIKAITTGWLHPTINHVRVMSCSSPLVWCNATAMLWGAHKVELVTTASNGVICHNSRSVVSGALAESLK